MIGWYAQWGRVTSSFTVGQPYNVNNFITMDDSLFTLATKLDDSLLPIKEQYAIDAALKMETAMTQRDFSTVYVLPVAVSNSYYSNMKSQLPCLGVQCPNLLAYKLADNNNRRYSACRIPSLNRLIITYNFGSNSPLLYVWDLDGNYVGPIGSLFSWAENFIRFPVCVNYDGTRNSLIDGNNFKHVTQVQGGSTASWYQFNSADGGVYTAQLANLFGDFKKPDVDIPDNPYEPYPPSGTTDPELPPGTFDDTSDPIPMSPLPTLSAANTGFTRIYNPTLAQVQELAKYLWTDDTVIETIWNHIKQFFEDPMEAIIGFNLVPVPVPDGGTKNFALMFIDTGVQMTVAANQFVDVDCGTVKIERYYGSALDQSPNTKVSCFLPFIGMVQFNTDEVMGATLNIIYRVDIVSGSCVAHVLVDGNAIYQYSGHCAIPIPFNSADFSNYVSSAISVAKLAVGAAVGGAAGAGAVAAEDAEQQTGNTITKTTTTKDTERNPSTGRQITTSTRTRVETIERPVETNSTQASYAGLTPQNVSNTVGQIMGSKPHIQHSGSFSGNTGYLGVRRPFLIIERPNMCLPENYQTLNGFPSMITMALADCKGYTRVQQVQLTGMTATNPEQAEILQLLKSGVVF